MSESRCLDPEQLDAVFDAAPEDPRRVHARGCARCGALLDAYRLYREAPAAVPGHEIAEAEHRMAAALDREMAAGSAAESPRESAPRATTAEPRREGWFAWLSRPAFALATAAAVLVVGLVLMPRPSSRTGEVTLRGGPPASGPVVKAAEVDHDRLALEWSAVPGAAGYEVVFYGPEFGERGRVTSADTLLSKSIGELDFDIGPESDWVVRVIARLGDGRELRSAAVSLEVR